MAAGLEIERKFLLKRVPWELLGEVRPERIRQGYLLHDPRKELRIRERDGDYRMTLKQGEGLARREQECPIAPEQFAMLWPLTENRRVEKHRYLLEQDGFRLEIDLFDGALAPLAVLEVEFESREDSGRFAVPDWAGREVTEEAAYKNAALALSGRPAEQP